MLISCVVSCSQVRESWTEARVAGSRVESPSEALMACSLSWIELSSMGREVVLSAMISQGCVIGSIGVGERGRKVGRRHLSDERRMV